MRHKNGFPHTTNSCVEPDVLVVVLVVVVVVLVVVAVVAHSRKVCLCVCVYVGRLKERAVRGSAYGLRVCVSITHRQSTWLLQLQMRSL